MTDMRQQLGYQWACDFLNQQDHQISSYQITPVAGDASFRRYFRLHAHSKTWILMDAPPEHESIHTFIEIAQSWRTMGLAVPEIYGINQQAGYLLLEDFGDHLLLTCLQQDPQQASQWYPQAIDQLILLQTADISTKTLPSYNSALMLREMQLFSDWLCIQGLQLDKNEVETQCRPLMQTLAHTLPKLPCGPVHRDYHSRNLLIKPDQSLGIIDFQDAVHGPLCYDLMSILRDCYIHWPFAQQKAWAQHYFVQAQKSNLLPEDTDFNTFWKQALRMSVQRHLKASGIFARLYLRDHKTGYLADIPTTLNYIQEAATHLPDAELQQFSLWMQTQVYPRLADFIAQGQN
ncbi:hypothetical protein SAMN05421831_10941 [Allopseudospirillum japonicum]|uniref:Aminoglycoside phosphotransferase domain-containing protein n=1 Tax=Allopseudospirillum japonicum TaxID=64971 RepID=A0A1H6T468_9GAMM|nr:phosphotransferase [Allopseudospirillum japonicum]SEI74831.1 hypothetical protein SAMN05421831_10941 [Allopseudospirillum japonicum]